MHIEFFSALPSQIHSLDLHEERGCLLYSYKYETMKKFTISIKMLCGKHATKLLIKLQPVAVKNHQTVAMQLKASVSHVKSLLIYTGIAGSVRLFISLVPFPVNSSPIVNSTSPLNWSPPILPKFSTDKFLLNIFLIEIW